MLTKDNKKKDVAKAYYPSSDWGLFRVHQVENYFLEKGKRVDYENSKVYLQAMDIINSIVEQQLGSIEKVVPVSIDKNTTTFVAASLFAVIFDVIPADVTLSTGNFVIDIGNGTTQEPIFTGQPIDGRLRGVVFMRKPVQNIEIIGSTITKTDDNDREYLKENTGQTINIIGTSYTGQAYLVPLSAEILDSLVAFETKPSDKAFEEFVKSLMSVHNPDGSGNQNQRLELTKRLAPTSLTAAK